MICLYINHVNLDFKLSRVATLLVAIFRWRGWLCETTSYLMYQKFLLIIIFRTVKLAGVYTGRREYFLSKNSNKSIRVYHFLILGITVISGISDQTRASGYLLLCESTSLFIAYVDICRFVVFGNNKVLTY